FTLCSGKKSNIYIDIKIACTHPELLELISNKIKERTESANISYDKIACVELGGVPIAVSLSLITGKPYIIFRKQKKEYGTGGDLIGEISKGEKILVVEDVTTTGSSAYSAVKRVENYGGDVVALISVVDRDEGAEELFSKYNINFIPLMTKKELIEKEGL
ncbi:MAG TPA: orotate phosphoribosyltransferase, partial [Archaeoglobaceae archaeon]|nr:orotate phosphoribosyltransferase [Archaeoglobaceae archaeon]